MPNDEAVAPEPVMQVFQMHPNVLPSWLYEEMRRRIKAGQSTEVTFIFVPTNTCPAASCETDFRRWFLLERVTVKVQRSEFDGSKHWFVVQVGPREGA